MRRRALAALVVLSAAGGASAVAAPRRETVPVPGTVFKVPRWPHGVTGYTVIVASKKTRGAAATAAAAWADGPGYRCGVLKSSEHASLRPGWWVAWCGRSSRKGPMQAQLREMRTEWHATDSYVRWISRRR